MNRLEFNEVLEVMDLTNPVSTTGGRYGPQEEVHCWNNLALWFGGSYYTIVHGKVPLEVANIIYNKYPDNPYEIRVAGGCSDNVPEDWAHGYKTKTKDERYIDCYHIDTKEGLIILLSEMKDYYLRKNNQKETEVNRYDEIVAEVTRNILKAVNPSITAYKWMQSDEKGKKTYNDCLRRDNNTVSGKAFRDALLAFDKAVNPFEDEDVELDDVSNYIDKVRIDGVVFNEENGKRRNNCCRLEIGDLEDKGSTFYNRLIDGFLYRVLYLFDEDEHVYISHYFTSTMWEEERNGEIISISRYKDDKQIDDIVFNLTKGTIGTTYGKKLPVTFKDLNTVYEWLLKGAELANKITVENMEKKENIK